MREGEGEDGEGKEGYRDNDRWEGDDDSSNVDVGLEVDINRLGRGVTVECGELDVVAIQREGGV